jgi:hypothetical protein
MQPLLLYAVIAMSTGVVITDNVWVYGEDHAMHALQTGDVVAITSYDSTMVNIECEKAQYRVLRDILIDFDLEIAPEKLLVFAHGYFDEREFRKAARLFSVFTKHFDTSVYYAEALYYHGLASQEIARTCSISDTVPDMVYSEYLRQWIYSGTSYATLIEQLPENVFTPKARYRLLLIQRMIRLPWQDSVAVIDAERSQWLAFAALYEHTDEYVMALLEAAYLSRVLFEITGSTDDGNAAINLYNRIMIEFPETLAAAQARLYIFEIRHGENIYKY